MNEIRDDLATLLQAVRNWLVLDQSVPGWAVLGGAVGVLAWCLKAVVRLTS